MKNQSHLFYQQTEELLIVKYAKGCWIWDQEGKSYLDASSGAIVCNIGHGNKKVLKKMSEQAEQAAFAYRTQFESYAALNLARELVDVSSSQLSKVFFVSGGSEAVESAMKLAKQYYFSLGEPDRNVFISLRTSYHGSTLGALSLTGYAPLERPFKNLIAPNPKIPSPDQFRIPEGFTKETYAIYCAEQLEKTILDYGVNNIAGFVLEPIGGASTGARVPLPIYFKKIQEICHKHGVLLILDEVLTGFGRTGEWFAYQHWDIKADIVAVAKGMGSGYYPIGAILTRKEIVESIMNDGGFMHGHTYAGNPLACATGLAVVEVIKEESLVNRSRDNGNYLRCKMEDLAKNYSFIGDVRGKGLLQCFEFVSDQETKLPFPSEKNFATEITRRLRQNGLIVYPRRCINGIEGDHILIAPPLIIKKDEIDTIISKLDQEFSQISLN